jgi:hypothetical protein
MNVMRFEAEVLRGDAVPADVVRERAYGRVRVDAEWPDDLSTPELRIALRVSGDVDRRDAPAYAELFFHDVFLLLNLATPGSFAGTVSITGGELRVRELTFRAYMFDPALEPLPLDRVTRWYDALGIGTQQLATTPEAVALFQLLHLARIEEDEQTTLSKLQPAIEGLQVASTRPDGHAPVIHPMHDDALDPRVEPLSDRWIEAAEEASKTIVAELRKRIAKVS